jgi:hypothetical protein
MWVLSDAIGNGAAAAGWPGLPPPRMPPASATNCIAVKSLSSIPSRPHTTPGASGLPPVSRRPSEPVASPYASRSASVPEASPRRCRRHPLPPGRGRHRGRQMAGADLPGPGRGAAAGPPGFARAHAQCLPHPRPGGPGMPVAGSSLPNGPEPGAPRCAGPGALRLRDRRRGSFAPPSAAGVAEGVGAIRYPHRGTNPSACLHLYRCRHHTKARHNPEEAPRRAIGTAGWPVWTWRRLPLGLPRVDKEILHRQEDISGRIFPVGSWALGPRGRSACRAPCPAGCGPGSSIIGGGAGPGPH